MQAFAKKHAHQKSKWPLKLTEYAEKNAISSSADPRTPRLLTSQMYVHDCKCAYMHYIQSIYIYIYVCMYVIYKYIYI